MVQISSNFGAEITFKDNYFEIHGTENEVRSAVAFLMDQEILKVPILVFLSSYPLIQALPLFKGLST